MAWGFCCTSCWLVTFIFSHIYCHFTLSCSRVDQRRIFAWEPMPAESGSQLPDGRSAEYGRPISGMACHTVHLGWLQKGTKIIVPLRCLTCEYLIQMQITFLKTLRVQFPWVRCVTSVSQFFCSTSESRRLRGSCLCGGVFSDTRWCWAVVRPSPAPHQAGSA